MPKRRVIFFLPGFSIKPVGGYKVAYEYANFLARDPNLEVRIVYSSLFRLTAQSGVNLVKAWIGRTKGYFDSRRSSSVVPWFKLDQKIVSVSTWGIPAILGKHDDIYVATAAQTVPFVHELSRKMGSGTYFIQHWEEWSVPRAFVEQTWRMPLNRIVIAPWLADIGTELGVSTTLVHNAINPIEFPRGPSLKDRKPHLLAMVSAEPFKRTDLIVDVLVELESLNRGVSATTFGTCARPRDLPEYVTHIQLPSKTQLTELYQASRVYLCASDAEGWHLPPAEAILSGTPVVSTDIGGVRAYADGIALFSPVGEKEGLVSNICAMLDDLEMAQHLADEGYRRLIENSPEDAASRFRDALMMRS